MDLVFYSDFNTDNVEIDRVTRIKMVDDQNVYESAENFRDAILNEEDWAIDVLRARWELEVDDDMTVELDDTIGKITVTHPDQTAPSSPIRMILEEVDTSDMGTFGELPLGDPDVFVGEYEEMDLSKLAHNTYMVAVSTGPRDKSNFLPSTCRGPYDFYSMCEAVGTIYKEQQLHSKAIIMQPDLHKPLEFLDECTIDFIEARYMDIVTDGLLGGVFDDSEEYTCQAGVIEHSEQKNDESDQ